ncbi:MAG: type II secretion system protein [Pseudomonadota bacterium]
MKKNAFCTLSRDSGFTLPEIIAAIVLIGILGAMAAQFMASALEDSTLPIDRVQAAAGRVSIMEKIISDYVIAVNSGTPSTALTTIETNVLNGNYNSGATTVATSYIDFNGAGQETTGGSNYLKVTVTTGNASIVTIFSKSRTLATDPKVNF